MHIQVNIVRVPAERQQQGSEGVGKKEEEEEERTSVEEVGGERAEAEASRESEERVLVTLNGSDHKGIVHAVASVLSDMSFDIETADVCTSDGIAFDHFVCVPPKRMAKVEASDLQKLIESRMRLYADFKVSGLLLTRPIRQTRATEVWEGEWGSTRVAVKVVGQRATPEDMEMLREETRMWKQLRHPHVCPFYGVASFNGGQIGIVMEICACSLSDRIHSNARLRKGIKIRWMLELASALAHVHSIDIMHRDVKPANVLLDDLDRIRLADFGLARMTSGELCHSTGETGTYKYMAPEVVRSEPYSFACDMFSFAITCWELFRREQPFASLTPVQTACGIASGLRPKGKASPDEIDSLLCLCWDQDPLSRLTSQQAMDKLMRIERKVKVRFGMRGNTR